MTKKLLSVFLVVIIVSKVVWAFDFSFLKEVADNIFGVNTKQVAQAYVRLQIVPVYTQEQISRSRTNLNQNASQSNKKPSAQPASRAPNKPKKVDKSIVYKPRANVPQPAIVKTYTVYNHDPNHIKLITTALEQIKQEIAAIKQSIAVLQQNKNQSTIIQKIISATQKIDSLDDVAITNSQIDSTVIGKNSPAEGYFSNLFAGLLSVNSIKLAGGLKDKDGDLGLPGQVLSSTGTSTDWIDITTVSGAQNLHELSDVNISTTTLTTGDMLIYSGSVWEATSSTSLLDWNNIQNRPAGLDDGDDDTTYSAGNGLALSGTVFSITAPTCSTDEKLVWNGAGFICQTDNDTQYTAGYGLLLSSNSFSIDNNAIKPLWHNIQNTPADILDGDNQKIDLFTFSNGIISLSLQGDNEAPKMVDISDLYSSVAPLQINNRVLSIGYDNTTISVNSFNELYIPDNAITTNKLADNSIINSKIADNSIENRHISNKSISDNKIDWGTNLGQVSARDIPVEDANNFYTQSNIEDILQHLGLNANKRWSTGLVSGGMISDAGSNKVNISAGSGFINDSVNKLKEVSWSNINNVSLPYDGDNFIYIDVNGNPYITNTPSNSNNYIYLGYAYTVQGNADIGMISYSPFYAGNYTHKNNNFLHKVIGVIVESGNIVSEGVTPLSINVSGGVIFSNLTEYNTTDSTSIIKWYKTSDLGWVQDTNNPNKVSTNLYNDPNQPASSALVNMSNGYWKKDLILRTLDGNVHYIYGQAEYPTEQEAKDAPFPTIPDAISKAGAAYLATIVSKQGDTSIANRLYDVRPNLDRVFGFGTSGTTGSVADHGNLTGLTDDDHPQYALVDGSRAFTGNLNLGNNSIFNVVNINMSGSIINISTTTPQIKIGYDNSNYFTSSVASDGSITFDSFGLNQVFTFKDNVDITGDLSVVGNGVVSGNVTLGQNQSNTLTINSVIQGINPFVFEGSNVDSFETVLSVEEPTADRTIVLPDVSGILSTQSVKLVVGSVLFADSNGQISQDNNSFYWDSTNKRLGLGTNNPLDTLHISGGNLRLDGAIVDSSGLAGTNGQVLTSTATGVLWKDVSSLGIDTIYTSDGSLTSKRTINLNGNSIVFDGSGYVGIGTTNPAYRLHVQKDDNSGPVLSVNSLNGRVGINGEPSGGLALSIHRSAGTVAGIYFSGGNAFIDGDASIYIRPGGGLTATSWQFNPDNTRVNGFDGNATLNLRAYSTNRNTLTIQKLVGQTGNLFEIENTDGSSFVTVKSSGNVGIGTANPTEKLHVAGNIHIEGTFKDSSNQPGTIGQVLTSTGTGTLWVDANSIGVDTIYASDGTISGNRNILLGGNSLAFDTSTLFIDGASGNIGIGTTTPIAKLDIAGSVNIQSNILIKYFGNDFIRYNNISSSLGIGTNTGTLSTNTTGNTIIGKDAAAYLSSGDFNTVIGNQALLYAGSGTGNTAVGYSAGRGGVYNSVLGANALTRNSGAFNTAFGSDALRNSYASYNAAFGSDALRSHNSGNYNVAIGYSAGRYYGSNLLLSNAQNSIYIGANSKAFANNADNEIVIGYNAVGNGSNSVTLGNDLITKTILKGNIGIGTTNPTQKLDVAGNIRIQGALFDSLNSQGVQGQVLTVNANGNIEWQNPVSCVIGGAKVQGNGTVLAKYGNISTITRTGTGQYTINFANPFASVNDYYAHVSKMESTTTRDDVNIDISSYRVDSLKVIIHEGDNNQQANVYIDRDFSITIFDSNCTALSRLTSSDERLKTNIQELDPEDTFRKLLTLNAVRFNWDIQNYPYRPGFDDKPEIGFIAQQVKEVFPEVVDKAGDGYYTLDYEKLTAVAVSGIKYIWEKLTQVDEKIQQVWEKLTGLEEKTKEIDMLKRELCRKDRSYSWCSELNSQNQTNQEDSNNNINTTSQSSHQQNQDSAQQNESDQDNPQEESEDNSQEQASTSTSESSQQENINQDQTNTTQKDHSSEESEQQNEETVSDSQTESDSGSNSTQQDTGEQQADLSQQQAQDSQNGEEAQSTQASQQQDQTQQPDSNSENQDTTQGQSSLESSNQNGASQAQTNDQSSETQESSQESFQDSASQQNTSTDNEPEQSDSNSQEDSNE